MPHTILVAYTTRHGSTQEIAAFIARTLRENGLSVDLLPIHAVSKLDGYHAVVLGAPLYMFHWHDHALKFLARFQQDLRGGLPIAIFAGGPIEPGKDEQFAEARANLDQELAKFPWLKPASVEIVGGRFEPTRLTFPYKLIPAIKNLPPADLRNWDAICQWTLGLIDIFGFRPNHENEQD